MNDEHKARRLANLKEATLTDQEEVKAARGEQKKAKKKLIGTRGN
jgi:hypothetical protein